MNTLPLTFLAPLIGYLLLSFSRPLLDYLLLLCDQVFHVQLLRRGGGDTGSQAAIGGRGLVAVVVVEDGPHRWHPCFCHHTSSPCCSCSCSAAASSSWCSFTRSFHNRRRRRSKTGPAGSNAVCLFLSIFRLAGLA